MRQALAVLLLVATCVAARGVAAKPTLPELTQAARVIAIAELDETQSLAEDRLRVHRLAAPQLLKGEATGPLSVVEESRSSVTPFGPRVLVFLGPPPRSSFAKQNLPKGEYWTALSDGVFPLEPHSDAAARQVIEAYQQEAPDEHAILQAQLRSGSRFLVLDAVRLLKARPQLSAWLVAPELRALESCIADDRVSVSARARLIRVLGERKVDSALAILERFEPKEPVLMAARAEALGALGRAPEAKETARYLSHPSADVRRVGLNQLAASDGDTVVAQLESVALGTEETSVRVAAIEALGRSSRPDAAEVIARTFDSDDPSLRRASAKAFYELGGEASRESLEDLVYDGSSFEVQQHALMLMMQLGAEPDGPEIQRIRRTHPSPRMRKLIEHGLDDPHHPR